MSQINQNYKNNKYVQLSETCNETIMLNSPKVSSTLFSEIKGKLIHKTDFEFSLTGLDNL